MNVKLLIEHHLEFLSLKGDFRGSHESTLVKMLIVGNRILRLIWFTLTLSLAFDKAAKTTYANSLGADQA